MAGGGTGTPTGATGGTGTQAGGMALPSWVNQASATANGQPGVQQVNQWQQWLGQQPGATPTAPAAGASRSNLVNGYIDNSRTSSLGTLDRALGLQGPTSAGNYATANTQQQGTFDAVPVAPLGGEGQPFQIAQQYNANPNMPQVPGMNLMGHPAWAQNAWAAGNGSWTEGGEAFDAARTSLQGAPQKVKQTGDYLGNPKPQAGNNNPWPPIGGPPRVTAAGSHTTIPQNHPFAPDYNPNLPGAPGVNPDEKNAPASHYAGQGAPGTSMKMQ